MPHFAPGTSQIFGAFQPVGRVEQGRDGDLEPRAGIDRFCQHRSRDQIRPEDLRQAGPWYLGDLAESAANHQVGARDCAHLSELAPNYDFSIGRRAGARNAGKGVLFPAGRLGDKPDIQFAVPLAEPSTRMPPSGVPVTASTAGGGAQENT